ncbi:hypothetical protein [Listeria aquatica]
MKLVKEKQIKVDGTSYQLKIFINEVYTQIRYVLLDSEEKN